MLFAEGGPQRQAGRRSKSKYNLLLQQQVQQQHLLLLQQQVLLLLLLMLMELYIGDEGLPGLEESPLEDSLL